MTKIKDNIIISIPNTLDLKISKILVVHMVAAHRDYLSQSESLHLVRSIISGGKVGICAALVIFFGKKQTWIYRIKITADRKAIKPREKARSICIC